MKKLLIGLMITAAALSVLAGAQAKPMGGGRSFGRQSPTVARQAPPAVAPSQAQRPAAAPAPAQLPPALPPKPASPWKGIIGGALLGLGVGALLSHFGMGGAIGSAFGSMLMLLLLVLAVVFIVRMFRRSAPQPLPYAGGVGGIEPQPYQGLRDVSDVSYSHVATPEIGARIEPQGFQSAGALPAAHAPWGVPADFDTPGFLRHAKSDYIRMQAAWDKADVNDIREFTTPEVYAEIKLQLQERGASADFTDVVSIDADLLGMEAVGDEYLASVKFSGTMKAAPNAPAEPFAEVWNLAKPVNGTGRWLLAGIQQLN